MQKRRLSLTILAAVCALIAIYCTFIVMGRADDPAEESIRNKALTGFLLLWPLSWIVAQAARKTKWRTIFIEAIFLLPVLWIAYSFLAAGRTVSP